MRQSVGQLVKRSPAPVSKSAQNNKGAIAQIIKGMQVGENPTPNLFISNITAWGGATKRFRLVYDGITAKRTQLPASKVIVTGPDGYRQVAQLVASKLNRVVGRTIAFYRIQAPGGSWGAEDNGNYVINLRRTNAGNLKLGQFKVRINARDQDGTPSLPTPTPVSY
uniref:hypothetical protein n=1 Tax=Oculatella sp. LEGE 06141 TaxID=1828648 RepID=UPI0019E2BAE7|nr:hypothetical protein [Oculatella sp. LEGE 06141]